MNAPQRRNGLFDTLYNLVTSLGTTADKLTHTTYQFVEITPDQLEAAYRGDWIARKVIDIPPQDATREWRAWQATEAEIELLEEAERALGLQGKVAECMALSRLYGGAVILLGVRDDDPSQELVPDGVQGGDLKYMHVLNRHEIGIEEIDTNVRSPFFGEPKFYTMTSTGGADPVIKVHPSRVIRMKGARLPSTLANKTAQHWGDSVLHAIDDAVKAAGSTVQGLAHLIMEAKNDIIKIPGLTEQIVSQEYQNLLMHRLSLANQAKSIANATVIDKEEEWERMNQTFTGIPEVLRVFLTIVAGAADIPATRFLSQSPGGLNATGDSDTRNYYDRVKNEQNNVLRPTLSRSDEVMIRSALGKRPPELHYVWNPLWQLDEVQKADVDLKRAQTTQIYVNSGMVEETALSEAVINQLIENGTYPGLDQAILESTRLGLTPRLRPLALPFPGEEDDDEDDDDDRTEDAFNPNQPRINDAKPRTLYVSRPVLNTREIIAWARAQGIPNIEKASELHVTIAYSKEPVDWMRCYTDSEKVIIQPGGPRIVEPLGDNGALVLLFNDWSLQWRWDHFKAIGCSWSYSEYQPHVTIAYDVGDFDVSSVEPYRGRIVLGPERFEEIGLTEDAFNPSQPRHKKGDPRGGKWSKGGGGLSERTQRTMQWLSSRDVRNSMAAHAAATIVDAFTGGDPITYGAVYNMVKDYADESNVVFGAAKQEMIIALENLIELRKKVAGAMSPAPGAIGDDSDPVLETLEEILKRLKELPDDDTGRESRDKGILTRDKRHATEDFNPNQPRHKKGDPRGGEWAGGAGLLARLEREGGFTYHVTSGSSPTSGYVLSIHKDRERVLDIEALTPTDLVNYVAGNQDLLGKSDHYLGAWHNTDDGKVYLDVAVVTDNKPEADRLAREHNQLAYFDLKKKETVHVGRS